MARNVLSGLIALVLFASAAAGQSKIVELKGGGRLTGIVTKIDGGYQVETAAGIVNVAEDQVVSIEDAPTTPADEYRARLAQVDPESASDRFELGEWAFRMGMLREARRQLRLALEVDPDFERANLLLKQVEARLAAGGDRGPGREEDAPGFDQKDLITPREVNRIRLAEIAPMERVRVSFQNRVLDRFLDMMRGSDAFRTDPNFEARFRRLPPHIQLDYMLRQIGPRSWALRDDMIVRSDPEVMSVFRRRVWPLVARSCAQGDCHGAPRGRGNLKLFNVTRTNEPGMYTNFLILDMYARGGYRMVYRDLPERSLLLEYGLRDEDAKVQHPTEIQPVFRSLQDPNYRVVRAWIDSLAGPPHPEYGVSYQPPFGPRKSETFDPLSTPPKREQPSAAETQPAGEEEQPG